MSKSASAASPHAASLRQTYGSNLAKPRRSCAAHYEELPDSSLPSPIGQPVTRRSARLCPIVRPLLPHCEKRALVLVPILLARVSDTQQTAVGYHTSSATSSPDSSVHQHPPSRHCDDIQVHPARCRRRKSVMPRFQDSHDRTRGSRAHGQIVDSTAFPAAGGAPCTPDLGGERSRARGGAGGRRRKSTVGQSLANDSKGQCIARAHFSSG